MLVDAYGYQWIGTGAYEGPWILGDGFWCLWIPVGTNGQALVLMKFN